MKTRRTDGSSSATTSVIARNYTLSRLSTEPSGVATLDSHFTPGDPFTAKAGITIHLW